MRGGGWVKGKEEVFGTLVMGNRESDPDLAIQGSTGFGGDESALTLICRPQDFLQDLEARKAG